MPPSTHPRQHGLHEVHGTEEHHVHQLTKRIVVEFLDGADRGEAGVVDENVDPAEPFGRGRDRSVDLLLVGDIERDCQQPAREPG